MSDNVDEKVRELLAAGRKIEAIKLYREETGLGLAEAKSAVEEIDAGGSHSVKDPFEDKELVDKIVNMLERGEHMDAVKLYREQAGAGMMESKKAVDSIAEKNGINVPSGSGCLKVILLGISTFAAVYSMA